MLVSHSGDTEIGHLAVFPSVENNPDMLTDLFRVNVTFKIVLQVMRV